jgi:hypothetical protein
MARLSKGCDQGCEFRFCRGEIGAGRMVPKLSPSVAISP